MNYTQNYNSMYFPTLIRGGDGYISLSAQVAKKSADLIWGRGFSLETDKEDELTRKSINEFIKYNRFEDLAYTVEVDLSSTGNIFVGCFLQDGKPVLLNSAQDLISRTGEGFVEMEMAVTWHRLTIDNRAFPVRVVWDREKYQLQFVDKEFKFIGVEVALKEIPEAKRPQTIVYHNLGIVPVVHFKNRPGAFHAYSAPDHWTTGNLEQDYNHVYRMLIDEEAKNNITKVYARMEKKDKKQIRAEAKEMGIPLKEYIQRLSAIVHAPFEGDHSGDSSKPSYAIVNGNLKAKEWSYLLNQIKEDFFNACGYSFPRTDQAATLGGKGDSEAQLISAQDIRTTATKIKLRQKQWNEMLLIYQLMFKKFVSGKLDGEIIIDIKGNTYSDSKDNVEKSIAKLTAGLSSRKHEIMRLEAIGEVEAENRLQEIIKEQAIFKPVEQQEDGNGDNDGKE